MLAGVSTGTIGCADKPKRIFRLPEGSLPVRYEAAGSHSTCLVASVAMAANYLMGERRFSEKRICDEVKQLKYDETRVGDLKAYLEHVPERLHLLTLAGNLDSLPPTGLPYWLEERGYPVICVINRDPAANPAFNHAVVVIGISANQTGGSADIIHYLDPSSAEQLHSTDPEGFEQLWAAGDHAMMIVCHAPAQARP
jgi:hypothetical protein